MLILAVVSSFACLAVGVLLFSKRGPAIKAKVMLVATTILLASILVSHWKKAPPSPPKLHPLLGQSVVGTKAKYPLQPLNWAAIQPFYLRNLQPLWLFGSNSNSQQVLFRSSKGSGCTYFLSLYAKQLRKRGYHVVHIKVADMSSMKSSLDYLLDNAIATVCDHSWSKSVIIVDDYTHRSIGKAIIKLLKSCKVNILLNTQKPDTASELYQAWHDNHLGSVFGFQVKDWSPLNQFELFSLIVAQKGDGMTYQKAKTATSFEELSQQFSNTRQEDLRMQKAMGIGLRKQYSYIRNNADRRIGKIIREVEMRDLFQLQEVGLIILSNGLAVSI